MRLKKKRVKKHMSKQMLPSGMTKKRQSYRNVCENAWGRKQTSWSCKKCVMLTRWRKKRVLKQTLPSDMMKRRQSCRNICKNAWGGKRPRGFTVRVLFNKQTNKQMR